MRSFLLAGLTLLFAQAAERPVVLTTFYPTSFFTERIAGPTVELTCVTPADADPATWTPDRDTLRKLQSADLVILNGAEFESWARRVSLRLSSRVNTALGFKAEWLEYEEALTHSHGTSGEHAHRGVDGHTWLDPIHARQQAEAILGALQRTLPERADEFQGRFEALARDLGELDRSLRALGDVPSGRVLLASHPAYNYLARRYGWPIVNLDLDPALMPDQGQLAEIRGTLEATPADFLLWESAPAPAVAARLEAAFGLKSVVFSPCEAEAPAPADTTPGASADDYLARMRRNVERLQAAFAAPKD